VVFIISNRGDKQLFETVLRELKKITGPVIPQYFMTDDTNVYWDSWNLIMGEVKNRLLCTWHIKKNWTIQGKKKIKNNGNQKHIQKMLNDMLKATEENEFWRLGNSLISYLQLNEEDSFLDYFTKYYLSNQERIASWAHCYRKHAGINTNMHLEALHKNL
jgi:hypothetical protein